MPFTATPSPLLRHRHFRLWLAAGLLLGLTACSTPMPPAGPTVPVRDAGSTTTQQGVPPPMPTCCTNPQIQRDAEELQRMQASIAKNTIYFAYDAFQVSSDQMPIVEAHARFLLKYPQRQLKIAGHADERGGREYNLALGQKRADALGRALEVYGVPAQRIEAVSYGAEVPVATGSDEASWQLNRRAELIHAEN